MAIRVATSLCRPIMTNSHFYTRPCVYAVALMRIPIVRIQVYLAPMDGHAYCVGLIAVAVAVVL